MVESGVRVGERSMSGDVPGLVPQLTEGVSEEVLLLIQQASCRECFWMTSDFIEIGLDAPCNLKL